MFILYVLTFLTSCLGAALSTDQRGEANTRFFFPWYFQNYRCRRACGDSLKEIRFCCLTANVNKCCAGIFDDGFQGSFYPPNSNNGFQGSFYPPNSNNGFQGSFYPPSTDQGSSGNNDFLGSFHPSTGNRNFKTSSLRHLNIRKIRNDRIFPQDSLIPQTLNEDLRRPVFYNPIEFNENPYLRPYWPPGYPNIPSKSSSTPDANRIYIPTDLTIRPLNGTKIFIPPDVPEGPKTFSGTFTFQLAGNKDSALKTSQRRHSRLEGKGVFSSSIESRSVTFPGSLGKSGNGGSGSFGSSSSSSGIGGGGSFGSSSSGMGGGGSFGSSSSGMGGGGSFGSSSSGIGGGGSFGSSSSGMGGGGSFGSSSSGIGGGGSFGKTSESSGIGGSGTVESSANSGVGGSGIIEAAEQANVGGSGSYGG